MPTPIHPIRNRLHLVTESVWGDLPGSPVYVPLPHTSWTIQLQNERRNAALYAGLRQRRHARAWRGMPSGQLTAPLFAWRPAGLSVSLAQFLLDWGFADAGGTLHEALDLPSKTAEYAEGPNVANARTLGLRVNQTTLAGADSSGEVAVTLDLMGKDEVTFATAQALPAAEYEHTAFDFGDVVFQLDDGDGGSLVTYPISSFQLAVANSLRADYVGARRPTVLVAGERVTTFQFNFPKYDSTFDALRRSITDAGPEPNYVAKLILKGLHRGTGTADTTWTQVTIDLPMLRYSGHDSGAARGRDDFARLPLTFDCLKPDGPGNDIAVTWADVS